MAEEAAPEPQSASWTDASTSPATLTFRNDSAVPVELIWRSYDGEDKAYNVIAPGLSTLQETYSTHVWRVATEERVVLVEYAGPSATINIMPDGYAKVYAQAPATEGAPAS